MGNEEPPWFVHSDLLRALPLIASPNRNPDLLVKQQIAFLRAIANGAPIWMPAYNYGFPQTRNFDVSDDPSEVGILTERFRVQEATWRSWVPIFSVSGEGGAPFNNLRSGQVIDPFGEESSLARLCELNGKYVFFGAPLSSLTLIHLAESKSGSLTYRYTKTVSGEVTLPEGRIPVTLRWHVRPRGLALDYDWERLESDLTFEGLLQPIAGYPSLRQADARQTLGWLISQLHEDPLYLLDMQSRRSASQILDRLGRPFAIEDFESP